MKKVLFAILAAMTVLFVSCDPDEAVRPTVSFETAVPIMSDGVATIRILVQNYSGEAVTVPVTFGGTAVEGTDYTVSAEAFVIGGTDPVTEIVITPLTYDSSKTISASFPDTIFSSVFHLIGSTIWACAWLLPAIAARASREICSRCFFI